MNQETAFGLIDKRLDAITGKLSELAEKYGPEVVDAALTVVQIDAAQVLLIAALFLGVAIYSYPRAKRTAPLMAKQWNDDDPRIFAGAAWCIVTLLAGMIGVTKILTIWTWIALYDPKLVIAHKILEGLL